MTLCIKNEESQEFEEFRSLVSDLSIEDDTLIRFLRARDLNPKRAEEMLRKSLEWRELNGIESVTKWEIPSEIPNEFKVYFTGLDDNNFPVYLIHLGKWDSRKVLGKGLKEECMKFMYKSVELILTKCRKLEVFKFTVICDNEGLNLWKCAHWDSIETMVRVIKDFEANYPETLLNAFLVNTPTVFWQAFKFIKPILTGNTLQKIHIFDSDMNKWSASILEKIPSSAFPTQYGGSGTLVEIHSEL